MILRSLVYKNYRGLKDESTKLEDVNHIIGKNGSGKTSIVEAAVMLLNGRSFQGISLMSLSNNDKKSFRLPDLIKTLEFFIETTSKYKRFQAISSHLGNKILPILKLKIKEIL